jgi:magnesium transporter
MAWHHIADPQSPELDQLAQKYDLHPLHIEDCRSTNQRIKVDERPEYLFVVLRPVVFDKDCEVTFSTVNLFVGRDYAVTVGGENCPGAQEAFASARKLADENRPDQILYRIFDSIADGYLPAIDCIDDRIDLLEDRVLDSPAPDALEQLFCLKRTLVDLRRVLVNTRDVAIHFQRESGPFIDSSLAFFFRDIYDHVARNLDTVETQRDLLAGTLDVYLSSLANRTNSVMKVLTVLSTTALPAVIISSLYGMNVKNIPFSESPHAVWIVIGTIVITTLALLGLLKKYDWF